MKNFLKYFSSCALAYREPRDYFTSIATGMCRYSLKILLIFIGAAEIVDFFLQRFLLGSHHSFLPIVDSFFTGFLVAFLVAFEADSAFTGIWLSLLLKVGSGLLVTGILGLASAGVLSVFCRPKRTLTLSIYVAFLLVPITSIQSIFLLSSWWLGGVLKAVVGIGFLYFGAGVWLGKRARRVVAISALAVLGAVAGYQFGFQGEWSHLSQIGISSAAGDLGRRYAERLVPSEQGMEKGRNKRKRRIKTPTGRPMLVAGDSYVYSIFSSRLESRTNEDLSENSRLSGIPIRKKFDRRKIAFKVMDARNGRIQVKIMSKVGQNRSVVMTGSFRANSEENTLEGFRTKFVKRQIEGKPRKQQMVEDVLSILTAESRVEQYLRNTFATGKFPGNAAATIEDFRLADRIGTLTVVRSLYVSSQETRRRVKKKLGIDESLPLRLLYYRDGRKGKLDYLVIKLSKYRSD